MENKRYNYIKNTLPYCNNAIFLEVNSEQAKIECPYCHKQRWIKNDHLNRRKNTLCPSCGRKTIPIFYTDELNHCSYFYVKNKNNDVKVLIDTEDVEKLKNCSFGISCKEQYVKIVNGIENINKPIPLTNYLLNHAFDENKYVVDHRNHNIYDNQKSNLFIVTQTLNQGNKKNQSNNITGFRGISWDSNKHNWQVQVRFNRKFVGRKRFINFLDAYSYWYDIYHQYYKDCAYNILEDATIQLKYAKIEHFDIQNGEGIGYTLYVQGCSRHCHNCQNPQTWDFDKGFIYSSEHLEDMVKFFNTNPNVHRLTLCGGEPLENLQLCNLVAAEYKRLFPKNKLWLYTGFRFEEIMDKIQYRALLSLCDVVVDGQYIDSLRDLTLKWKGSSNQRVIDVRKSLEENKVVLFD